MNTSPDRSSSLPESPPQLSIVVPTFNESDNVAELISRIDAVLGQHAWEVIFVDDNSPDGTAARVREIGIQDRRVRCIRRIGRRGLAGACIEGMLSSQAKYVAVMDADLQHDEALLEQMLETVQQDDVDLVVASRYMDGGFAEGFSAKRHKISLWATELAQRLLHLSLSDPMSGFFMIERQIVEQIAPSLTTQGYKILLDIVTTARGRLRIAEIPFTFRQREHGESKFDTSIAIDFISLIIGKLTYDLVSLRFILFGMVGLSGLVLHLFLLRLHLSTGMQFEIAQGLSTAIVIGWNFLLNNMFTYRDQRLRGLQFVTGLLRFELICALGAISNIGVASWVYATEPVWWIAGIGGALMGAMWNYLVSSALVWKVHN
ncbi:MAG: glycosyltransferase family 2 protein [Pseudomonadota bacterium]